MAEIKDSQLIRDALGSPVPQYWDETSQMYIARTVDGSFADVDFSKVRLLRDKLGSPIPQLWDIETAKFVPGKGGANGEVTIESVPGLRSELDQTNATLAETEQEIQKRTNSNKKKPPLMTIVSDDGQIEDYTQLLPILDSKGIKATFGFVPSFVATSGFMTTAQGLELQASGHEISSHTYNHLNLANITAAEVETELKSSYDWLTERGFNIDSLIHPYGGVNQSVMEISRKYYKFSMATGQLVNKGIFGSTKIYRISVINSTTAFCKAAIDEAVANNGWVIFYTHGYEYADALVLPRITELIDYAKTLNVRIDTAKNIWSEFGNPIDLGLFDKADKTTKRFVVSSDGEVDFTGLESLRSFYEQPNGRNNASPQSAFKDEAVTTIIFKSTDNSGLPGGAGTLVTVRGKDPVLSHQTYYAYTNTGVYRRNGLADGTFSTTWNRIDSTQITRKYTFDLGVIPAKSYKQVYFSWAGFLPGGNTIASVTDGTMLEAGLIYSAFQGTGSNMMLRVFNCLDTDVTTTPKEWTFRVLY